MAIACDSETIIKENVVVVVGDTEGEEVVGGVELDGRGVMGDRPLNGVTIIVGVVVVRVGDGGKNGNNVGTLGEAVEGEVTGGELDTSMLVDEVKHCTKDVEEDLIDCGDGLGCVREEIVEVGGVDRGVERGGGIRF